MTTFIYFNVYNTFVAYNEKGIKIKYEKYNLLVNSDDNIDCDFDMKYIVFIISFVMNLNESFGNNLDYK